MKRWIALFFSVVISIIGITLVFQNLKDNKLNYTKITFEEYKKKLDNKESVLIYFYENGCQACQGFSPTLNEVIKEKKLTVYAVELSEYKAKYKNYFIDNKIKEVPILIYYDKGIESKRIGGGATSKSMMEHFLEIKTK